VRFIDNFSTGLRGAASAEKFLENGYAVIFLHRAGSAMPFARHLQRLASPFVDLRLLSCLHAGAGPERRLHLQLPDGAQVGAYPGNRQSLSTARAMQASCCVPPLRLG
jgi:phosphopantothenate-cysteine ligase